MTETTIFDEDSTNVQERNCGPAYLIERARSERERVIGTDGGLKTVIDTVMGCLINIGRGRGASEREML